MKECGLTSAPEAILYAKVKDNHEAWQKLVGANLCGLWGMFICAFQCMNIANILGSAKSTNQREKKHLPWSCWSKHLITVCHCLIDWPEDIVYPGAPALASYRDTEKQEPAMKLLGALLGQVGK